MLAALAVALPCAAFQARPAGPDPQDAPRRSADTHRFNALGKTMDDVLWHLRLDDIAVIDKVRYTGPPAAKVSNPTGQGALNPLVIPAYTFIPKKLDRAKKHPLIVFVHGGVHSDFGIEYHHIVRELLEQGYPILAPEYRGSTGYGSEFHDQIDYGGREVDDVWEGRSWAIENLPFVDPQRIGIIGWSHGGMIALLNIFRNPEGFACAYAGVPVSDLVARMGYKSDSYRRIFSAPNHIGKSAEDDVKAYLERSPVTHASKLRTPLLIHTTTNDEDVNVLEVERLIAALRAEGKKFEYKIYQNAPGGHAFNRIDTKLAKDSRAEIWAFLARYLTPGK